MPVSLPVQIEPFSVIGGPNQQVIYPQVGMANQSLQGFINQSIIRKTQELINKQVSDMSGSIAEMVGEFEIKNNQRGVLSLTQSNYTIYHMAANGITYMNASTFDLENGKECRLRDLFKPGSNYTGRISDIIKRQIAARDIPTINEFTRISPDQSFYIADKTLVIYFQLFEYTPHSFGFPIFPISVYEPQDIISETGPLSRLATNN
ncbi:DUF3298 and DUF4163 domain-containing protein [Lentibacillus cibarius]|uniref:DUF3298 and DUF4163 domain-containing protein n=1 Tax=Lentibacillus cibarius TaxID=2583219 RepID=A0A549YIL0_9BACI|nr:DUF3298 and DUF4163 domain-containing protein [Lentibacillus cibarius]TRM11713.1 DUF3298 and DUF4163 domain-containing protein [Lentibacillus cibarius]